MNLDQKTFLRVLKGAPLSALLSIWIHGAANRKELSVRTGYSPRTLDTALDFLESCNLVFRAHHRKWALASGFEQLPLLKLSEGANSATSAGQTVIDLPSEVANSATSANDQKGLHPSYPQPEVANSAPSAAEVANSAPSALATSSSRSSNYPQQEETLLLLEPHRQTMQILAEHKIYGAKQKKLARMPHVIEGGAAYIAGHVAAADKVGQAIYRMEHKWDVPELTHCPVCKNEFDSLGRCLCDVVQR